MSDRLRGTLIGFLAVIILSPDSLFIRLIDTDSWTLVLWRGAGMSVAVLFALAVKYGSGAIAKTRAIGWPGVGVIACFAVSSILFVLAVQHTTVANTLAIIGLGPLMGAVMSHFWLSERIALRTWIASLLALGCVGIIVAGSIGNGGGTLWGDLAAFLTTTFFSASFVLMRQAREVDMLPAMGLGGLLSALTALLVSLPAAVTGLQAGYLLVLCGIILPLSFALMIVAPRFIPAPELNMILLLEMLLGPLFVWLVVKESPPLATLLGGGLLFLVLVVHGYLGLHSGSAEDRRTRRRQLLEAIPSDRL